MFMRSCLDQLSTYNSTVRECSYKQINTYFESLLNAVRCDTKDSPPTRRTVPKSCEISHLDLANDSFDTMLNSSTWWAHYPAAVNFAFHAHVVSMKYPFTHKSICNAQPCLLVTTSKMCRETTTGSDFWWSTQHPSSFELQASLRDVSFWSCS